MNFPYIYGQLKVLSKMGMDSEVKDVTEQLEAAVKDEAKGHGEYLDMAEEADEAALPEVESMARSHASDELKHFKSDSKALSEVK